MYKPPAAVRVHRDQTYIHHVWRCKQVCTDTVIDCAYVFVCRGCTPSNNHVVRTHCTGYCSMVRMYWTVPPSTDMRRAAVRDGDPIRQAARTPILILVVAIGHCITSCPFSQPLPRAVCCGGGEVSCRAYAGAGAGNSLTRASSSCGRWRSACPSHPVSSRLYGRW